MSLPLRSRVGFVRLRVSRVMGQLAGLALATPVLLALIEILFRPWAAETWLAIWRASLLGGVGGSLVLALGAAVAAGSRSSSDGVLRLEASDVVLETVDGVRRVPLASVHSGLVVPQARGARIELQLSSGDKLTADVPSLTDGEQTLRQLGLDAAKRRASVPLMSRGRNVLRRVGWITAAIIVSLGGLGMATDGRPLTALSAAVWLTATTTMILGVVGLTRERAITIGADGVLIQRRFGDRFLGFDTISAVKAVGRAVSFELTGGERAEIVNVGRAASVETARTIAVRVEEAVRARRESPDAAASLSLVSRAGRSVAEWKQAVARLAQRTQDYRGVALSTDDLLAILESPTASEEHRLGAALALSELGSEEYKARVRVAANACAREPMRVALEKVADGDADEAALEEALAVGDKPPELRKSGD